MGKTLLAATLALACLGAAPAAAEAPEELRFDTSEALLVDTTLALGFVATQFLTDPPDECSVCTAAGFEVDAARAFGAEEHAYVHHLWSTWLLGAMLVGGAGWAYGAGAHEGGSLNGIEDLVAVSEAVVAAQILTRSVKIIVQRRRPGALLHVEAARIGHHGANYSFFSGHSSISAAVTFSLATVAHLRGYSWKFPVGIVGATLSLAVGIARMASYRHWLSDVLVGWFVGATVGVLVPFLLHGGHTADPLRDRQQAAQATQALPLLLGAF